MKACLSTLYLAVLVMVSVNARSAISSYDITTDSQLTLCEQIAQDLPLGTWTASQPAAAANDPAALILQFRPAGQLDLMEWRPSGGDYVLKQFNWTVQPQGERAQLLLWDQVGRERRAYDLTTTIQGMQLTEVKTGEQIHLAFHARVAAPERKRVQESLVGEWTNSLYPFELSRTDNERMAGAFLYYQFSADGSYSKSLGNSEAQIDETGEWEISADGQFLLMHTQAYEQGRRTKKTTAARIKFVRYDEMVLEHSLQVSNERFCTERKDFYFSRI